ncbi:MAG TPA: phosphotransferase [Candidatus Limnocylindrales bacterium]
MAQRAIRLGDRAWLEATVRTVAPGSRLLGTERASWGFSNVTDLVALDDGRRLAVQRLSAAALARPRVRLERELSARLADAGIPAPRLLAAAPEARPPYLVTSAIDGTPGPELMGDGIDAIALGTEMGRLVRRLWAVDVSDVPLPSVWAMPARLAALGDRWLNRVGDGLDAAAATEVGRLVGRVPAAFAGRPAVLAHGDWAPANVLVVDRAVVAVLDWEFARLADPLFDPAWWGWVVWHHHPDTWGPAWSAFLETAGIELDPETVERVRILVALRLLEVAASPRLERDPRARADWLARLAETILAED